MSTGDTCTPVYQLPYPTGSSRPCDVDDTMCAFHAAVEEQLSAIDSVVDQLQNAPFAYVLSSVSQSYNNNLPGAFIPTFDTTLADNDNMVDLALDSSSITIQTPGVYSFFAEMDVLVPSTGTSATVQPVIRDTLGTQVSGNFFFQTFRFTATSNMPVKTDGTALANVAFTTEFCVNVSTGYTYSFLLTVGGPLNLVSSIQTFRAGATWLRGPL